MSELPAAMHCPACHTELAAHMLNCPSCQRLVHAERLKALATQAEAASQAGDLTEASRAWREALELLPPGTRQHELIRTKVDALARQIDASGITGVAGGGSTQAPGGGAGRVGWKAPAGAVGIGLLLWKLKWLVVLAITKGKLLLMGLTKGGTLFSMLAALGVYWSLWGWKFALGLVVSIYIHEMGHVAALVRYGIKASPPMFIPGVGAVVRLKQQHLAPYQDARMGLAGPWWGLGAALGAYGGFLVMGWPVWAAIASIGALINLFNLLPIPPLDGGRGFGAMSRGQRLLAALVIGGAWYMTGEGMLVLLLIVAGLSVLAAKDQAPGDAGVTGQYVLLIAALSALTVIHVPHGA